MSVKQPHRSEFQVQVYLDVNSHCVFYSQKYESGMVFSFLGQEPWNKEI
jgi:hypothetical protein